MKISTALVLLAVISSADAFADTKLERYVGTLSPTELGYLYDYQEETGQSIASLAEAHAVVKNATIADLASLVVNGRRLSNSATDCTTNSGTNGTTCTKGTCATECVRSLVTNTVFCGCPKIAAPCYLDRGADGKSPGCMLGTCTGTRSNGKAKECVFHPASTTNPLIVDRCECE